MVNYITDDENKRWLALATDGACRFPRHQWLARAGCAVYVAPHHRLNYASKLCGPRQSSARAEARALLHVARVAEEPVWIYCDNQRCVRAFQN
eukprot:7250351-Pyramimonas_sp.AAC.1